MDSRIRFACAAVCLALLAPCAVLAQQPEPPLYTFVATWNVPRAQWDNAAAFFEKTTRPVVDRHTSAGTLVGWGNYLSVVHLADETATTHGTWFASNSLAAIERVREELIKIPNPAMANAKHRDYLLRSLIHKGKPSGPAGGYLWVNSLRVQPGKAQQWREFWEKNNKPSFDELVANGTIVSYSVDVEHVHTDDPGLRFVVYVAPSGDALDKVQAALAAVARKRTPEENRAIAAQAAELTVAGAHRDYYARVMSQVRK